MCSVMFLSVIVRLHHTAKKKTWSLVQLMASTTRHKELPVLATIKTRYFTAFPRYNKLPLGRVSSQSGRACPVDWPMNTW